LRLVLFVGLVVGISFPSHAQTVIVIYKQELRLEIWKDGTLTQQFSICSLSSIAGRKKAQGDQQVPEGIYAITSFNPKSASYKTLRLNYPNAFDRSQGATGGDIGIHGKCASVGCIGMRNDQMDSIEKVLKKELKRLPIPVLIFYSERSEHVQRLIQLFKKQKNDTEVKFLERLEQIRVYWDEHHRVPKYTWDKDGYVVKE
jgi:murein L,D-transpeptidase YafK